jgi:hypothetical protein
VTIPLTIRPPSLLPGSSRIPFSRYSESGARGPPIFASIVLAFRFLVARASWQVHNSASGAVRYVDFMGPGVGFVPANRDMKPASADTKPASRTFADSHTLWQKEEAVSRQV